MPYNPIHKISIFKLGISPCPQCPLWIFHEVRASLQRSHCRQPWHLGKDHENIQDGDFMGFHGI